MAHRIALAVLALSDIGVDESRALHATLSTLVDSALATLDATRRIARDENNDDDDDDVDDDGDNGNDDDKDDATIASSLSVRRATRRVARLRALHQLLQMSLAEIDDDLEQLSSLIGSVQLRKWYVLIDFYYFLLRLNFLKKKTRPVSITGLFSASEKRFALLEKLRRDANNDTKSLTKQN